MNNVLDIDITLKNEITMDVHSDVNYDITFLILP
jgi:hypothetical protein